MDADLSDWRCNTASPHSKSQHEYSRSEQHPTAEWVVLRELQQRQSTSHRPCAVVRSSDHVGVSGLWSSDRVQSLWERDLVAQYAGKCMARLVATLSYSGWSYHSQRYEPTGSHSVSRMASSDRL